ncbi:MAG: hypothetical protein AAGU75_22650, partial [Bacillota bacterium]
MLTLPAIFLVLITSILIASMFEIKSKIAYFLAIYLFSISNVILTCTVTGFFHQLDNQYFFALIHGLIFVI